MRAQSDLRLAAADAGLAVVIGLSHGKVCSGRLSGMVPSEEAILTNLRRGALEYCVLAAIADGEGYGFDIARRLSADGLLLNGEGTLYPLLSRLRKSEYVSSAWKESTSGPPRRYYQLTPDGERALAEFARLWRPFRTAVDSALDGDAAIREDRHRPVVATKGDDQ